MPMISPAMRPEPGATTITVKLAATPVLAAARAVMVVRPTPTAVIAPFSSIVATEALLELYSIFGLETFAGLITAWAGAVSPGFSVR